MMVSPGMAVWAVGFSAGAWEFLVAPEWCGRVRGDGSVWHGRSRRWSLRAGAGAVWAVVRGGDGSAGLVVEAVGFRAGAWGFLGCGQSGAVECGVMARSGMAV